MRSTAMSVSDLGRSILVAVVICRFRRLRVDRIIPQFVDLTYHI
jgi:hypothetical protein